jgi:hypothetical protein
MRKLSRPKGKQALFRALLQAEELEPRVLLTSNPILPPSAYYSSLPGAKANVYLDFTGDYQAKWGSYSNITTPAYNTDGDPTTFSTTELANIQRIWAQAAEDFSPFNINVTTVQPSSLAHGVTQKVVIGGNGSWSGQSVGGLTGVGSFADVSQSNVSFVFSAVLNNGDPTDTADIIAHEAGHGFGLDEQSQWSGTTLANYFYPGPGDGTAPIMGNPYGGHALWWYGTSSSGPTVYENNMAIIASSTNGFGYRPIAAGISPSNAVPLTRSGNSVSAYDVIESYSQNDYWSFATGPGTITLNVTIPAGIGNLTPRAELVDSLGNVVVAWQGPNSSGGTTLTATVAGGTYCLVVASAGPSSGSTATSYGFRVGQYSVSGTIVPTSAFVAAQSNPTANAVPGSPTGTTLNTTATLGSSSTSSSVAGQPAATVDPIFATGADAGGQPLVNVYDARTGALVTSFFAFPANFTGGVRVAVGDVNGDGAPDIICAAGPGGGPEVTVFDGKTFQRIMDFMALPATFTGGVFVAAGDIQHKGYADIVTAADAGGGPEVTIWCGKDGSNIAAFYATTPQFTGGIRVACADINGDGFADVIAAAGPGGGPQVTLFDGKSLRLLTAFYALPSNFTGGMFIAAGDLNGDGKADIIVGAEKGGAPEVNVFNGADQRSLGAFFALSPTFSGGVRVATAETTGSSHAAILTAAGPGGRPQVSIFDGKSFEMLDSFFALPQTFAGGVFVGGE